MVGGVLLVGNIPTITIAYWIGDTTNYNHTSTNAERGREQRIRFAAYELSKALGDKVKSSSFPALVQFLKFFVIVNMFHKPELINRPKIVAVIGVKVWGRSNSTFTPTGFVPDRHWYKGYISCYFCFGSQYTQTQGHDVSRCSLQPVLDRPIERLQVNA